MNTPDTLTPAKIDPFIAEKETPVFVFELDEADMIEATSEEEAILDKMRRVADLYRSERESHTLDLEITEEAFRRLKGRPGFRGNGYSRLVQIIDESKVRYHVIVSPFTTVPEIKRSNNPDREELVLIAKGLNMFEGHDIRFELILVSSHGLSDLEDRSEIFPSDLLRIELIPNETATYLISEK